MSKSSFSIFDDQDEVLIKKSLLKRARCRSCIHLNFDYIFGRYEHDEHDRDFFCGLHGMASVDPDGFQKNLDRRGSCGYSSKQIAVQLTFDF